MGDAAAALVTTGNAAARVTAAALVTAGNAAARVAAAALAGLPAPAIRVSPTTETVARAGHLAFTDIEELISLGSAG
jgi:hypothetical protein